MGTLTVADAEELIDDLFAGMPPEVVDFVALGWGANKYFEAGSADAMATVVAANDDESHERCLRLRAGDINTLRAPYRDGVYVVLDPRELADGEVERWRADGWVEEEVGTYAPAAAPWAIGVAIPSSVIADCSDELLGAHRRFVRAVSGGRSGARFKKYAENAVGTVLHRRARELESD